MSAWLLFKPLGILLDSFNKLSEAQYDGWLMPLMFRQLCSLQLNLCHLDRQLPALCIIEQLLQLWEVQGGLFHQAGDLLQKRCYLFSLRSFQRQLLVLRGHVLFGGRSLCVPCLRVRCAMRAVRQLLLHKMSESKFPEQLPMPGYR